MADETRARGQRRRIWVQHVAVEADRLQMQVAAAERRGLNQGESSIADGVSELLGNARAAALGDSPRPHRFPNWWRGTLVEAARPRVRKR